MRVILADTPDIIEDFRVTLSARISLPPSVDLLLHPSLDRLWRVETGLIALNLCDPPHTRGTRPDKVNSSCLAASLVLGQRAPIVWIFASRSNGPTANADSETDELNHDTTLRLWPSWRRARKDFADCALGVLGGPVVMSWLRAKVETGMPPAPSRILRISTETLPERDRCSAMQEEVAQKILKVDMIDRGARHSRFELAFTRLGPVAVGDCLSTSAELIRHNHHLKDCVDGFRLDIIGRGPVHLSHAGEERTYDVGWGHFLHHARPFRQFGPCGFSNRNVTMRPAALKAPVAHPEDLAGHPVRPGPALGLLDGYLQSLTSLDELPSPELAPIIGGHLLDLVAAALGPTAEAAEFVAKRGVKAARLRATLAEVARRFSEPDFDLDNIAGTLGLSRRYIQELLEETGKSFTEHLVERRLQRALSMLTDQRCLHLAIIDIAFAAGFGDVSHFNRCSDGVSAIRRRACALQGVSRNRSDPASPHNALPSRRRRNERMGFTNTSLRHDCFWSLERRTKKDHRAGWSSC